MRPMTSSRRSSVASISIASAAIWLCGASRRSRCACSALVRLALGGGSRTRVAARRRAAEQRRPRSGGAWRPASSAARRSALTCSLAVRNTFTAAPGATTVPMSRPSATIPPVAATASAMIACCCAISWLRICGHRGDQADHVRHPAVPDRGGDVDAVDPDVLLGRVGADLDGQAARALGHRLRVGHVHVVLEQPPRHGPVHRAGVEIPQPEGRSRPPRGTRLARSRRAVDGDRRDLVPPAVSAASGLRTPVTEFVTLAMLPASHQRPERPTAVQQPPGGPRARRRRPAAPANARS